MSEFLDCPECETPAIPASAVIGGSPRWTEDDDEVQCPGCGRLLHVSITGDDEGSEGCEARVSESGVSGFKTDRYEYIPLCRHRHTRVRLDRSCDVVHITCTRCRHVALLTTHEINDIDRELGLMSMSLFEQAQTLLEVVASEEWEAL